jgi:hypothetical protein
MSHAPFRHVYLDLVTEWLAVYPRRALLAVERLPVALRPACTTHAVTRGGPVASARARPGVVPPRVTAPPRSPLMVGSTGVSPPTA